MCMKSVTLFRFFFLVAALVLGALVVRAEDLNAVRARMEQRVAAVDALKDRGAVGENNRGLLEPRGALSGDEQKTVSDENADRRIVYVEIGKQTGADADAVGRARAQRIAVNSKRGVWLQGADGNWYQKN